MEEAPVEKKLVGKISHYFTKIGVGVVELSDELKVGDRISIEGATTNVQQTVDSMQIEHENVQSASSGQSIGLKIVERTREGDLVYKLG
ncbi:MAG: translation elongation factor-like protein [Hadesarchaea archaeon]|nr:translation elongation factor-like protein [Hadesarchaea archaeon]MDH5685472.1 translation elongation factor-like protein [Hadesarchaea archaeon]